jgi:hypothetical protein
MNVRAIGFLAVGLWACGAGNDDAGNERDGSAEPGANGAVAPSDTPAAEVDVAPEGAAATRYQFVETPGGMTVEAIRADGVQTTSCPTRTCAGMCDECALAACRAAGELEGVCGALLATCESSCTCQSGSGAFACGFPVCSQNRWVCYLGDGQLPAEIPGDPAGPDPTPEPFAGQPSSASGPSGSGASTPTP